VQSPATKLSQVDRERCERAKPPAISNNKDKDKEKDRFSSEEDGVFPFAVYTLAKSRKYRRKYVFGAPSESERKMWFTALENYYHIGVGTTGVATADGEIDEEQELDNGNLPEGADSSGELEESKTRKKKK